MHRYIGGKMFVKMRLVALYVKLLTVKQTDKQTDRQTNAEHYITSLSDVINSHIVRAVGVLYTGFAQFICVNCE